MNCSKYFHLELARMKLAQFCDAYGCLILKISWSIFSKLPILLQLMKIPIISFKGQKITKVPKVKKCIRIIISTIIIERSLIFLNVEGQKEVILRMWFFSLVHCGVRMLSLWVKEVLHLKGLYNWWAITVYVHLVTTSVTKFSFKNIFLI